jgi:predicted pyridoxine 5'-phosphate oxidase superfamily flavin-nucleotide-binding protein
MSNRFFEIAFTPKVQHEQELHGSRNQYQRMTDKPFTNSLGPDEQYFISLRDSFMATVTETDWPYIQHRGGDPGFVHVLSPTTLAFADLRGNKQYISAGNLAANDRVALFFMDYPSQSRLKLFGHMEVIDNDPALLAQLKPADPTSVVERIFLIHVEGFDWNCPQHITPRYTVAEIETQVAPLRRRLSALEEENAALRAAASRDTLSS